MGAARKRAATVLVVLGLAAAACSGAEDNIGTDGTDEAGRPDPGDPVDTPVESSPFSVGHMPDGHRLVQAGQGTQHQEWGSDSFGTEEPITVLTPAGEAPGGPDDVVVAMTAYDGYQGGMAQAMRGYPSTEPDEFEIDGRPAMYLPGGEGDDGPVPADLVADLDGGHAVRVSAFDAGQDELVEIARAVVPPAHQVEAPEVPDPPAGLETVGSADADVVMALRAWPEPASEFLPVGPRGHVQVWAPGGESDPWDGSEAIAVSTLPGSAVDLDVLEVALAHDRGLWDGYEVTDIEVEGRPGAAIAPGSTSAEGDRAAIVSSTPEGDLVLVVADGAGPSVDDLVEIAASVDAVDREAWEELVLAARGGPGLQLDPGAIELERGTVGDVEWLLQARTDVSGRAAEHGTDTEASEPDDAYEVDVCLKLSTGERQCPRGSSSDGQLSTSTYTPANHEADVPLSAFVVISTPVTDATEARLHLAGGGTEEADLHELPGGTQRAGIFIEPDTSGWVFVDCVEVGGTVEPGSVELLDGNGDRLPCR